MEYKKIQVRVKQIEEYLVITIRTKRGRQEIREVTKAQKEDLSLSFWGDEKKKVEETLLLSKKDIEKIQLGETVGKYAPRVLVESWVREQKEIRNHREKSIQNIDNLLKSIHKLFLKEKRILDRAEDCVNSDILPHMDGSAYLCLCVIVASALKEFLKGHGDPRRIKEWEALSVYDLIDREGKIERGQEDAFSYLSAKGLLFDDDYQIDFDSPEKIEKGEAQTISCKDLLESVVEVYKIRGIPAYNPSIESLRSSTARSSGDPKLIALYCDEDDDE